MKSKQEKFLAKLTRLTCKELYNQLVCISLYMSIDLKSLIMDCEKDYEKFWALVYKYYQDYKKGFE